MCRTKTFLSVDSDQKAHNKLDSQVNTTTTLLSLLYSLSLYFYLRLVTNPFVYCSGVPVLLRPWPGVCMWRHYCRSIPCYELKINEFCTTKSCLFYLMSFCMASCCCKDITSQLWAQAAICLNIQMFANLFEHPNVWPCLRLPSLKPWLSKDQSLHLQGHSLPYLRPMRTLNHLQMYPFQKGASTPAHQIVWRRVTKLNSLHLNKENWHVKTSLTTKSLRQEI